MCYFCPRGRPGGGFIFKGLEGLRMAISLRTSSQNGKMGIYIPCCSDVFPSRGHLEPQLGPSWPYLGPSWAILAVLGPILGDLGAVLGPSWALLGPSWSHFVRFQGYERRGKTKHEGREEPKTAPREPQDGPKRAQDGPKRAPREPKMTPRWPKIEQDMRT